MKIVPFYFFLQFIADIFEICSLYKKSRIFSFDILHCIDCVQFILNLYIFNDLYFYLSSNISVLERENELNNLENIIAVSLFIMWIKLIFFLKLTKKFGVIIRIIELCFLDLANFLLIILIELFAFTIVFSILFEDVNEQFGDIYLTMRTSNFKLFFN